MKNLKEKPMFISSKLKLKSSKKSRKVERYEIKEAMKGDFYLIK